MEEPREEGLSLSVGDGVRDGEGKGGEEEEEEDEEEESESYSSEPGPACVVCTMKGGGALLLQCADCGEIAVHSFWYGFLCCDSPRRL